MNVAAKLTSWNQDGFFLNQVQPVSSCWISGLQRSWTFHCRNCRVLAGISPLAGKTSGSDWFPLRVADAVCRDHQGALTHTTRRIGWVCGERHLEHTPPLLSCVYFRFVAQLNCRLSPTHRSRPELIGYRRNHSFRAQRQSKGVTPTQERGRGLRPGL